MILTTLADYAGATSLHGVPYTFSSPRVVGRIFWAVMFIIGVTLGVIMVLESWDDWEDNPSITTVSSFSKPVTEIQFPTITGSSQLNI